MRFFTRSKIKRLPAARLATISLFILNLNVACQSKSTQTQGSAKSSDSNLSTPNSAVPSAQPFSLQDLDGKAYTIDGQGVTARAILIAGESRRPVFIDQNRIAFANRRTNLDRWQVFEADLAKGFERRVSFDAGDAEPVAVLGQRLVIASSSDERKSSDRILGKYQEAFSKKEDSDTAAKSDGMGSALQHLLLEHPANGRRGTEWVRMSRAPAKRWNFSVDQSGKIAVAVMLPLVEVYRVAIGLRAREPETRAWYKLKVEFPTGVTGDVIDGRIFPDGARAVWSNGSILWTTNMKGTDATRLGDDSIPAARELAVDPTGQWIVFSSPSSSRGLNLLAVHRSGRCLKTLTELPGDEIEPIFSPDGLSLLFALKQGDGTVLGKIPFGTPSTPAVACL